MENAHLQLNSRIVTGGDIFAAVDEVIAFLKKTNDLDIAENALRTLFGVQDVSGLALAKLLYGVFKWWKGNNMIKQTGVSYDEWLCSSVRINVKPITVHRYVSVWDKHARELFSDRIKDRPLKDQIAIAKVLEQGYKIDKKQWRELEHAESNMEVLIILREVKGIKPRKSALQIYLERDGSLQALQDGEKHSVGYLNIQDIKTDEIIEKAINRLLDGAGVIRK